MKKSLSIPLGIGICLLIGFLSRMLHTPSMEVWYPFLEKSALTPPDIVFTIVWGLLYVFMGISLGLLISAKILTQKKSLIVLFAVQLILNIYWNYLFFYIQDPMRGLICLTLLNVLALVFFFIAFNSRKSIALFFLPYLLWMLFAEFLNFYIVIYN